MIRTTLRNSVLTCLLLLIFFVANGQQPNNIAKWIKTTQTRSSITSVKMYKMADNTRTALPTVNDGRILQIDNNVLASLLVNHPAMIEIDLPVKGGQNVTLTLAKVQVTSDDFKVGLIGGDRAELNYENGIHYRGIVNGDDQSVASMSFFNNEVAGFYSTSTGDYTIAKVKDQDDLYAVYNEKMEEHPKMMECGTDELAYHGRRDNEPADPRGVACKVVKVYFVTDYKLYTDKGSNATNVTNYVNAFFNQVATLYQNENIDIQISQVYVYTTPDPYMNLNSTSAVLNAFLTNTGPNFNGDLAHFLTTRNLGGGIAYVNVLCQKTYAFGVSAIYNTFSNVPSFSWTVQVVTHELGHNLGSPHTQSCTWPGGAIDNCYTTEGGCAPGPAPTNGGTIMSYCHLTSYGINFNNGFGTLPGNLIRTKVTNASCLTQNGVVPTGLATSNIANNSATLTWNAVPNANEYVVQYKLNSASNWITAGTVTSPTITLNGLAANSLYNWKVKTSCSAYSAPVNFTTTTSGSNCSAPTNLTTTNIAITSATLSWSPVSGASSYTIQYKLASSSTWITLGAVSVTTVNLPGLLALSTYNWQVKANCSSYSAAVSFTTQDNSNCSAPTGLTASAISTNSATISWSNVSGASSYSVQYRVNGSSTWLSGGNTSTNSLSLVGLASSTTYQWQVKANCSVYSSIALFTTQAQGSNCSAPSNLNALNITHNSVVLSWASVSGATSYTVQYKAASSGTWFTLSPTASTSVSLTNLTSLTAYNWQVKANCSNYSLVVNFTTTEIPAQCPAPAGLATSGITSNAAFLSWTTVSGASSYSVEYKLASSGSWIGAGTVTTNNFNLSGLSASSAYEWRVKTNCSAFSSVASFTTNSSGCAAPENLTSSNITNNSAFITWSAVSGASNYTIQIRVLGASNWTTLTTMTGTAITVNGLTAGTTYQWQVKANCSVYSAIASFTTSTPSGCNAPTNLFSNSITYNSAQLSWASVSGASNYTIQIKLTTSSVWTTVATTSSTSINVTGLVASSSYNWQVKASCSVYSSTATFTTSAAPSGCVPPTGLNNPTVYYNTAACNWASVSGATSYTLIYRVSTTSSWTIVNNVTNTTHWLPGLLPGRTYIWHVKANCAANFSNPATFQTPSNTNEEIIAGPNYRLYPNPVKDQLNLTIDNVDEIIDGQIEIISSNGSIVRREILNSNQTSISTSDLSSGLYLLRVTREGSKAEVLKFVKAD